MEYYSFLLHMKNGKKEKNDNPVIFWDTVIVYYADK